MINNNIIFTLYIIAKNYKSYRYFQKRKKQFTIDWVRGPGYYISTGIFGYNPIGTIEDVQMESGKTGVFKLISYETFRDPYDMIKKSNWQFIGYVGQKQINDCTFIEFLKIYKNDQ